MVSLLLGIPMFIIEPILIPIENTLEGSGKWKHAQRLRKVQRYCRGIGPTVVDDITPKIEAQICLQEISQREVFLKEECQHLYEKSAYGPLTAQRRQLLGFWLRELSHLNEEYWRQDRHMRILATVTYTGPLARAYYSTQRRPEWHLQ